MATLAAENQQAEFSATREEPEPLHTRVQELLGLEALTHVRRTPFGPFGRLRSALEQVRHGHCLCSVGGRW